MFASGGSRKVLELYIRVDAFPIHHSNRSFPNCALFGVPFLLALVRSVYPLCAPVSQLLIPIGLDRIPSHPSSLNLHVNLVRFSPPTPLLSQPHFVYQSTFFPSSISPLVPLLFASAPSIPFTDHACPLETPSFPHPRSRSCLSGNRISTSERCFHRLSKA